jgi:glycosyltransferase involved in cell wall biosynthesis
MKVALLHFCFHEYTVELANALNKYVDLIVIQPDDLREKCKEILDPNVKVYSFSKPRVRDPRNIFSMFKMMNIIRGLQPDVLHVQETNDPWYDITLFHNKMPPLVTTIHDVFRHPGDQGAVPGSEYTRRIAFWRSQQLIVHAESLKKALIQSFNVPTNHVNILSHGELGSQYQRLSKHQVAEREPYTLLFYGRIWPYKGLKYLVEAMPLVSKQIPQVKLIIAGRGENLESYFPNGYDKNHYEIINRYIKPEEVATLFQRSTAVVLPYVEASQSGVAVTAFPMGTPVIASDVGGLAEMIQNQHDGLLVAPCNSEALASAIIKLLSNKQLQSQMQAAAKLRAKEDLNWSNIAAQTVEIYRKANYLKTGLLIN